MARNKDEIYNDMVEESKLYPSLQNFSDSVSSVFHLIMRTVAESIFVFETNLDVFKNEIEDLSKNVSPGTERWFVYKSKLFQYDDQTPQLLDINNRTIDYETVDDDKRIVTQSSCITVADSSSNKNVIFLKVAKGDKDDLKPLNNNELNALESYINTIKMAGQNTTITSTAADFLFIDADIYYNALYNKEDILEIIEDNLNEYLINLDFDGKLYYQKIVDVFQEVDGVQDIVINEIAGRKFDTTFPNRQNIIKDYVPNSGYIKLEENPNDLENNLKWHVV